jgi:hypothetical protein
MAGRLVEDSRTVLDAATLWIACAIIEPPDARE